MQDFIHKYKITSAGAFDLDTFDVVNAIMRGEAAFALVADFHLLNFNDPKKNNELGNIKIMMMPDSGWTWYKADGYAMTMAAHRKGTEHRIAVWEVLKYFAGPEFNKLNTKEWFGHSIFPEVYEDIEMKRLYEKSIPNINLYYKQINKSVNLQHFVEPVHKTSFYFEYLEDYVLPNLQQAVSNSISVERALDDISKGFEKLKENYGL
jgi:ABC-type glycerol-3-phosphate transport system substrate-binding protein